MNTKSKFSFVASRNNKLKANEWVEEGRKEPSDKATDIACSNVTPHMH